MTAREDDTNELLTFDRNRVRHRVLAELRRVNPRAADRIAHFAGLARADEEALGAWAERAATEIISYEAGDARVDRRALLALPPAIGSRVLRRAAERLGLRLDGAQVEQLLAIARPARRARLACRGTAEQLSHLRAIEAQPHAPGRPAQNS